MSVPLIILAAGASSRMRGRDKMLEDIGGVPLIRKQAETGLAFSDQVYVALPPRPHPRYAALEGLAVTCVEVADAANGMGASLRAGFTALPNGTTRAMLLLADLVEITTSDLRQVSDAESKYPHNVIWRGATQDGAPGHPILFDRSQFAAMMQLTGDTGGHQVINAAQGKVHLVPLPHDHARLDLDTPEDWAWWRARN